MAVARLATMAWFLLSLAHPLRAQADAVRWTASTFQGEKYRADRAGDGREDTHWAANNQAPVWIQAGFSPPRRVSRLRIRQVDAPRLYSNARRVAFSFSDGSAFSCTLPDTAAEVTIDCARVETGWVRMTIESAYRVTYYVGLRELAFEDAGETAGSRARVAPASAPPVKKIKPQTPPWAQGAGDGAEVVARLSPIPARGAHPTLFMNADDVERAKARIRCRPWARRVFQEILAGAERWTAMSDQQLRAAVPPRGALFDNKAECPDCGRACTARLEAPGKVACTGCAKRLPDAQHPDDGQGWQDPQSGRVQHFVGLYNSVAVDRITAGAADLAHAYVLTRDPRYARPLSVALDALAAIYPSCDKGPAWYPGVGGRLNRPFYQAARTLIDYAREYDLTCDSPEWDRPSCDPGAGSRRANYETNLLRNGAEYCLSQVLKQPSPGLHNGNCDYLQGALAVGRVLGERKAIDYVLESDLSIHNFIENTIDRDGQYFETSLAYSAWATALFGHHAELLRNDRNPAGGPPLNLYDHPKLAMNYLRAESDVQCAGHQPALGDSGPDVSVFDEERLAPHSPLANDRLEMLAARSSLAAVRSEAVQRIRAFAGGDLDACRRKSPIARWLLFHAAEIPEDKPEDVPAAPEAPTLLAGGRGIAILRSGTPQTGRRCALLRYGPTLNHGSPDELNVNLFAFGREISYDPGYGWAHHRCGWAHSTVAHNVVVVNQQNQLLGADGSGGNLEQFAASPSVQLVAADDPAAYAGLGVRRYRRLLAMVDLSPSRSYLLDLFDVEGGKQHDLSHHFLGGLAQTEGLELGPAQTSGSLAGPEYEWGKLVEPSGWIRGAKQPFYWKAPPGNGYGFLFDVRAATIKAATPRLVWHVGQRLPRPENLCAFNPAAGRIERQNDALTFSAQVPEAGSYAVLARFEKGPDRGRFVALVDNTPAGRELDAYSPVPYTADWLSFGQLTLAPGRHEIRIRSTGKDPESAGYRLALAGLALEPAGDLRRAAEPEGLGVAVTLLPPRQSAIVTAKAKGLGVAPTADYVLIRRSGGDLRSRFVSVVEPFARRPEVRDVAAVAVDGEPNDARRVIRVASTGGRKDYFFDLSAGAPAVAFCESGVPVRFLGRSAIVRTRDGEPYEALLWSASLLRFGRLEIAAECDGYRGRVRQVDYDRSLVSLDQTLPASVAGDSRGLVFFSRAEYSRNAPYWIAGVKAGAQGSRLDLGGASLVLGRGRATSAVSADGLVKNGVPLDRQRVYGRKARTLYFDGKALRNLRSGALGRTRQVHLDGSIELDVDPGLRQGDRFELLDIQAGDAWKIPAVIRLTRRADGDWTLSSNVPVRLMLDREREKAP